MTLSSAQMCAFICLYVLGLFIQTEAAITKWTTPSINSASGTATQNVAENQALNAVIVTFVAESDGSDEQYALETEGTPFDVSTDGKLTITSSLDHESQETYTIEVKVVNNEPASGTATITVTVTDVNEEPTFTKAMFGTRISKGSGIGTTISTATATDPDDGDVITYSINSGDDNSDFTIDGSTGVIKTAKVISGSSTEAYVLVVHAADDDTPKKTGSTTVAIVVADCTCSSATSLLPGIVLVLITKLSHILL